VLEFCESRREWVLDLITTLVSMESPTDDKAAVDRCGVELERQLSALGGRVRRHARESSGDHLQAEFGRGTDQILLLGHFDTVWPVGQIASMPLHRDGDRLYGPGVFDMKAGIGIAMLGVRALADLGLLPECRIVMLWTADEETGSATSRGLIEEEAARSRAVVVFEPALPSGAVKTSRKGCAQFELSVQGIAAHAGLEPQNGASAILELARLVLTVCGWEDRERGTSVNVGTVTGGSRTNVVAEWATASVDARFRHKDDAASLERRFRELRTTSPGTSLVVSGGVDRLPLERTAEVLALYEIARRVAAELGRELGEGATGGGSDGNLTAALGVPTLDGMGAVGHGAHARDEWIDVSTLGWRAALAAGLLRRVPAR
jgi:glutamate carboxypeptidase